MAQKRIRSDLWVATSDFMVRKNVWVRAGNTVVDGHPIMAGRAHKFRPFAPTFDLPDPEPRPTPEPAKPADAAKAPAEPGEAAP